MICKKCNNGHYKEIYSIKLNKEFIICTNKSCNFFQEKGRLLSGLICPISGGKVFENSKLIYSLESGLSFWKEIFFYKLKKEEIENILNGEKVFIKDFYSKEKKRKFSGFLNINNKTGELDIILD